MTALAKRGYRYFVTGAQIRKHMQLTPEQKLQWLEEANEFVEKFASEETKALHQKFRRGDI